MTADENRPAARTLRFRAAGFSIVAAFARVMIGLHNGLVTRSLQRYKPKAAPIANVNLEKFSATSRYYGGAAKLFFPYSRVIEIIFQKSAQNTAKRGNPPVIPETICPGKD